MDSNVTKICVKGTYLKNQAREESYFGDMWRTLRWNLRSESVNAGCLQTWFLRYAAHVRNNGRTCFWDALPHNFVQMPVSHTFLYSSNLARSLHPFNRLSTVHSRTPARRLHVDSCPQGPPHGEVQTSRRCMLAHHRTLNITIARCSLGEVFGERNAMYLKNRT